ncbi:lipopolysaccharide biosynthesis protein [Deinococcus sp. KSM4-11]|uniref:lipopolysaccharide biosynthesis protein n=1 Tax=Deinococcus sp. KSM4-11 TaxID=2568654 RepID=UPI0010A33D6A|nr:oligosaccharide flippase family protein [Deinococcus sp. KSM4-11]THF87144.1 lipopolysaccharide biosynthesis protein [Deinococcus sp. KSM4-11]
MSAAAGLSLGRNISWTLVGNVVYAASQWGMLVVLARLATPQVVGQYSLALAVSAPVFMALNLQLRGVQATDAAQDFRFGDYLTLRLITTVLALIVLVAMIQNYAPETHLVIGLIGLAKAFESISDVLYGRMQARERMDRIARSTLIKGPLSLLSLLLGFIWAGLSGAAGLLATSWLLLLLTYDLPNARRLSTSEDSRRGGLPVMGRLLRTALPLGVVMGLVSLSANLPRYQIEATLGTSALGIYSALAYLMVALGIVVGAVGQAASPRLARYVASGNQKSFWVLMGRMLLAGLGLGVAGVLGAAGLGRPVLFLMYGPNYAQDLPLFVWLMGAAAFSYLASFMGFGMTAARQFKQQVPLFALMVVLLWLLCRWLIPAYGLVGAAWATMGANVFQLLGSVLILFLAFRSRSTP